MLGGIFFQMSTFVSKSEPQLMYHRVNHLIPVALICYSILGIEFIVRCLRDRPIRPRPGPKLGMMRMAKIQLTGLIVMTVFIFIR